MVFLSSPFSNDNNAQGPTCSFRQLGLSPSVREHEILCLDLVKEYHFTFEREQIEIYIQ